MENLQPLPAFNGSNEYNFFLYFDTIPNAGERIYFKPDDRLDKSVLTGVRVHYYDAAFVGPSYDMAQTVEHNGIVYNVLPFADYKNLLLSIVDKRENLRLERCPASTFLTLPQEPGFNQGASPTARKALRISISLYRSFVEFTQAPGVSAPFVVPISLFYIYVRK